MKWRLVFIVLTSMTVLAACGSSGHALATNSSASSPFALSRCMHSHGVSNFPDPTTGPGGSGLSVSAQPGSGTITVGGIAFSGPAFDAAEKTCRMFGGGTGPPRLTEAQKEGMLTKARCIRQHGLSGFPDPMFAPDGHGAGINLPPGFNPGSPAFQRARQACANVGRPIPGSPT